MIKIGLADETLPFSEWFQLGGIDSFFGLHEYELLGKRLYQGGLEYRYRLPVSSLFDLHLFLRYDIATITVEKIEHLGLKDFFTGKGGGVGVVTPLGPARIAFGESDRDGLLTYFYFGWDF